MAMTGWLKQSTAATVLIGPFIDDTDGKTAETALTLSQADIKLSKNGGTLAQKNEATTATHDANGYYACLINTTDTNTLGILTLIVHETGALPVRHDYIVLPANTYDSLVSGTDYLQVDIREIAAGMITAAAIATGAIDADALATDAVTEIVAALQAKTHVGTVAAATASTLTLASGASASDDNYNDGLLFVIDSSGNVQTTRVSDYVGATKVATISPNWSTTPDTTYKYVVVGQ